MEDSWIGPSDWLIWIEGFRLTSVAYLGGNQVLNWGNRRWLGWKVLLEFGGKVWWNFGKEEELFGLFLKFQGLTLEDFHYFISFLREEIKARIDYRKKLKAFLPGKPPLFFGIDL